MGTGPDPDGEVLSLLDALLRRSTVMRGVQTCDCDDCVQDAWLALFAEHPDWNPADPRCQAWLRIVARNKAVDVVRRLQRHPDEPLDGQAFVSHWAESSDDPGDREAGSGSPRAALVARIREVLNGLSDDTRLILVQHAQAGRGYAEIGMELGLTAEQIRSRYNWARHWVWERFADTLAHACNWGGLTPPLLLTSPKSETMWRGRASRGPGSRNDAVAADFSEIFKSVAHPSLRRGCKTGRPRRNVLSSRLKSSSSKRLIRNFSITTGR